MIVSNSQVPTSRSPRRPWFQFSLGTLLLFVLMTCIFSGIIAWQMAQLQIARTEAIRAMEIAVQERMRAEVAMQEAMNAMQQARLAEQQAKAAQEQESELQRQAKALQQSTPDETSAARVESK